MLFIYNPHSGKGRIKAKLSDVIESFVKANYEVVVYSTQGKSDATNIVIDCLTKTKYDRIVCSGGDGTLNEVICGMMQVESEAEVGYIPAGTTNDFSTNLYLSKDMIKAAKTASGGKVFPCDIGTMNDTYFVYVAGFGAFTEVSYETSQAAKNMLGRIAYILEGAKRLPSLKSYHIVLEHDNERIEDDFIYGMISNSSSIGGFNLLANHDVRLDDGLFEAFFIRMPRNLIDLQSILNSLIMEKPNEKYIYTFRTDCVTLRSDEEISWAVDGEYGGSWKEVHIKNNPKAVTLVIEDEQS